MNYFSRVISILRTEGPIELLKKITSFMLNKIELFYYSIAAAVYSEIEYNGVQIPVNNRNLNSGAKKQFMTGNWETEELNAINQYFNKPRDFIDFGASTGFITTYILKNFDSEFHGVAVEANGELIPVIENVRDLNDVDFDIEHRAYHSSDQRVRFFKHNRIESGSVYSRDGRPTDVPAINLEAIVEKYHFDKCVIISDMEGGEIDLVANELSLLEDVCTLFIVEMHDTVDQSKKDAVAKLEQSSFTLIDTFGETYVYENDRCGNLCA